MKKKSITSELKRMKNLAEGYADTEVDEDDVHRCWRDLKSAEKLNVAIIKKAAAKADVSVDEFKTALGNYMQYELGTEELVEHIIGNYDW